MESKYYYQKCQEHFQQMMDQVAAKSQENKKPLENLLLSLDLEGLIFYREFLYDVKDIYIRDQRSLEHQGMTKEELEEIDRKRSLLKVPIAYKVDDSLEVPDLSDNFTPKEEKAIKRIKTEVVDIKIKKIKNKSNKLYE